MPARTRVAVVGGGWAGCTAALTLAEAGVAVTLYEAARTLGGRARAVALDGRALDNGQHILLGAYEQTLHLIERLSPANNGLWRLPLALRQPPEFALVCPSLPAPLHLAAGLLRAEGLDWPEKLAAALWVRRLLGADAAAESALTVGELTRDQPDKLNRLLWHPLCVSALNTAPDAACAKVFRNVIRDAFGRRRRHSDLVLPRRDLTELLPAPAAARLGELGSTVRTSTRILGIEPEGDALAVATRETRTVYTHVVIAVAPQHVSALTARLQALAPLARKLAGYRYEPIATGYVQYDPTFRLDAPLLALGGPAQFVFDRGQSHGQAGLLAFVASAAADLDPDWLDAADAQLRRIAKPGPVQWRRVVTEKQATYACTPGLARPSVRTAHPRVFLAGDYTTGPYPATLESATRSGLQSARSLLETL